jgi:putative transposase
MVASCIRRNQVVDYGGNVYRLVELLANQGWLMESMFDGTRCVMPHDELICRYARGEITLRVGSEQAGTIERKLRLATDPPFKLSRKKGVGIKKNIKLPNGDERSPEQQRRVRFIEASKKAKLAEFASQYPLGSAIQEDAIREIWPSLFGEVAPDKLPSASTIWRHMEKLSKAGGDHRALIPMHHLKGRRKAVIPDEIEDLITEAIEEIYLTTLKKTVRETFDEVKLRVLALNAVTVGGRFEIPSMQKIRERIEEISAFDRHAARYGLPAAIKKFRARLSEVFASRPLERVELDATRLDLIAIDENGVTLGRPWLTVCIDARTKCILGYC